MSPRRLGSHPHPWEALVDAYTAVDYSKSGDRAVGIGACSAWGADGPPADLSKAAPIRGPAALALSSDGRWLFSANRRGGSLSVVDARDGRVVSEHELARAPADLAVLPDGRLLVVHRDEDALLLVKAVEGSVAVEAKLSIASDPASVLVAPDGATCMVASTT